jgi:amino acid transporter
VELFTKIILLATLHTLIPYSFCTMAEIMMRRKDPKRLAGGLSMAVVVLSILAFLYSFVAIVGAGQETVYWGFLPLIAGVPVYVWINSRRSAEA